MMRRSGAGREMLNESDKGVLGSYMDDFFGPKEENHAAEDAYEWGWIEATRLERNRIRTIALEAAGLGAASIMEKAPDVEMPVDELIENVLKLIDEV